MGLTETSVLVKNGDLFVLIFAEPTAEHRRQSLKKLEKVFVAVPDKKQYLRKVYYIEPEQYGKNFGDIVPLVFWRNEFNSFLSQIILMLSDEQDKPFLAKKMEKAWYFNTGSQRLNPLLKQAYTKVAAWAEGHLKQPYTIMSRADYEQDKQNSMVVKLKFGYVNRRVDSIAYLEINHYLSLECDVEQQKLGVVRQESEQNP